MVAFVLKMVLPCHLQKLGFGGGVHMDRYEKSQLHSGAGPPDPRSSGLSTWPPGRARTQTNGMKISTFFFFFLFTSMCMYLLVHSSLTPRHLAETVLQSLKQPRPLLSPLHTRCRLWAGSQTRRVSDRTQSTSYSCSPGGREKVLVCLSVYLSLLLWQH